MPQPLKLVLSEKKVCLDFLNQNNSELLQKKKQILDNIMVLMAGRISEKINCHDITTGNANDISRVTISKCIF